MSSSVQTVQGAMPQWGAAAEPQCPQVYRQYREQCLSGGPLLILSGGPLLSLSGGPLLSLSGGPLLSLSAESQPQSHPCAES